MSFEKLVDHQGPRTWNSQVALLGLVVNGDGWAYWLAEVITVGAAYCDWRVTLNHTVEPGTKYL